VIVASILDSAGEALGGFLPRLGGAIALLVIGVVVARLVARGVERALRAVGADDAAEKHGVHRAIGRAGLPLPASHLARRVVRLTLTAVVVFAALSLLGLQFLSATLNEAILFIPRVVAAGLLVLAGVVLGDLARDRVDRITGQMDLALPLGQLVGLIVLGVFTLTAAAQVGVPTEVLTTLLAILVAAAAASVALAFGLGGRDAARAVSAGRYVRTSYAVGQTIEVEGVRGEITAMDQTAVVVRTAEGATVRIPNHHLLDRPVTVDE
jgi:small-conductance mechanosensitive channel